MGDAAEDHFVGHSKPDTHWERVITCGIGEVVRAYEPRSKIRGMAESHVFWYGDNLPVMREHIGDETVNLIYLDPPFNSKRIFNRFFGEADGTPSDAQRKAFEDYWKWGPEAERAYEEIVHPGKRRYLVPATLSQTMEMLRAVLRESNLLAYLCMMGVRLVEMRRALKPDGALYLHCDPTASHYLKLVLDALFGAENFRNELIWKRSTAHSDGKQGRALYGRIHDVILFYTKGDEWKWNPIHVPYSDGALKKYSHIEPETGRRYRKDNLTAAKPGGDTSYEWHGVRPYPGRYWAYSKAKMEAFERDGRLVYTKNGMPEYKRYLDEMPGMPLQDLWTDINAINSQALERTGYPTQKPSELLERIVAASTVEGDMVLDPFCGCGTAIVAAQRLKRNWIGIDITHVAVSVLKGRLEKEFPGLKYRVRGEPGDAASARRLADEKWEEFQAWVVDKVGGVPLNPTEEKKVAKKGKDGGIDGVLLFRDDPKAPRSQRMVLSVKAGKQLTPEMVDALHGVVTRERAAAGALLTAYKPTPGMYNTARAYGTYTSEVFEPGRKYPKIQIVTIEDIFDGKWRRLDYPGANTSLKSQPPPGTPGASEELFAPRPPRKGAAQPVDSETQGKGFKLRPTEPAKVRPKQAALKLKVPGTKGGK